MAGNSPFRGIVFCNLVPLKSYFKIRHHGKYCYPISFPIWLPQQCSRGTKKLEDEKKVSHKNVLIPWYPISYLMIASSLVFFLGAYGSLPDAAIWWCLRTGGGGVRSSVSCDCEFLDSVPNIGWLWPSKYLDGGKQMALGNWEL